MSTSTGPVIVYRGAHRSAPEPELEEKPVYSNRTVAIIPPDAKPACDTGEWPCRYLACPHCIADLARERAAADGASWCILVLRKVAAANETPHQYGVSIQEMAEDLGLGPERVRQFLNEALDAAAAAAYEAGLKPEDLLE
jgi:hypothetical protein